MIMIIMVVVVVVVVVVVAVDNTLKKGRRLQLTVRPTVSTHHLPASVESLPFPPTALDVLMVVVMAIVVLEISDDGVKSWLVKSAGDREEGGSTSAVDIETDTEEVGTRT